MLLNTIMKIFLFPMSQQRSGEKSCLAQRNKQQTNWETWHFSKLWTISNSTQFAWPLLVGEQFHTDLAQNHSKSYAGSQTHPNESQMLERSMECERLTGRGVQWRESKTKKKLSGRVKNIECESKTPTYFFKLLFLCPDTREWILRYLFTPKQVKQPHHYWGKKLLVNRKQHI